ncbi:hypothetical protein ACQEVZ_40555 [Dactylosporangium sp. CA-152071]|uniref:hypothetical protein n=1 Tax=Dactylosporangium sp. CA-152071 TaxID=3239933 RepID=UPI003D8F1B72
MIAAIMEGVPDVISGSDGFPEMSGASSLLTDGVWVWRRDLAYYLRRYHVALPDEFRDHAARNGYLVPPMEPRRIVELQKEANVGCTYFDRP